MLQHAGCTGLTLAQVQPTHVIVQRGMAISAVQDVRPAFFTIDLSGKGQGHIYSGARPGVSVPLVLPVAGQTNQPVTLVLR